MNQLYFVLTHQQQQQQLARLRDATVMRISLQCQCRASQAWLIRSADLSSRPMGHRQTYTFWTSSLVVQCSCSYPIIIILPPPPPRRMAPPRWRWSSPLYVAIFAACSSAVIYVRPAGRAGTAINTPRSCWVLQQWVVTGQSTQMDSAAVLVCGAAACHVTA